MSDRLELANRLDFISEVSDGGREPDHSSVTRRSAKALRDADCAIETLQAELAEARAKVERAREALAAFIHYDSNDEADGLQMMLDYDNALTAARAALKEIEP